MGIVRILIVDDLTTMRAFVKASIKVSFPAGVEVGEAVSAEMAMTALALKPCDIVICDWNMPGMKGTDLLAWVREQEGMKDAQFLMLTASNEKDVIMNAIDGGVDDFIMKPVSADTLSRRLQAALDRFLISRRNRSSESRPT